MAFIEPMYRNKPNNTYLLICDELQLHIGIVKTIVIVAYLLYQSTKVVPRAL